MLIPNPGLDFWNFHSKIHFWANLGLKSQRCLLCLKIGTHGISSMLILILTLVFWISNPNFLFGQIWVEKVKVVRFGWKLAHMVSWKCRFRIFDPKIQFWANLCPKSQSCLFYLKIGTLVISRFLILVPILVFWISKPKSIFGQSQIEKLKVVQFGWKLTQRMSRRCWFLFQHYVSQFPTLNPLLVKFGPKSSKSFWLKIGTHGISRNLILILITVFWIAISKSIFGQIWAKKVEAVCFAWKMAHKHIQTQYL